MPSPFPRRSGLGNILNELSFVNGESDRTIVVKMQANNIDKEALEDRGVCGAKGSG